MADFLNFIGWWSGGETVTLTIRRKSDGFYWTGSAWQAASATVSTTEDATILGSSVQSAYISATAPDEPYVWVMKTAGGDIIAGDPAGLRASEVWDYSTRSLSATALVLVTPLTAATNSVLQSGQQVEVVIGNKGSLFDVVLSDDWTAYAFRFSAKDEAGSSAYAIGPNDVATADVALGTDADGDTITTVSVRFAEGDLDIAEGVYTAELTADDGDSSAAQLITPIQFPLKVIEGLIG